MTSKEAFEEIIKACNFYHRQIANVDVDSIHGYPIKKIEKDLEVLEILKKWILVNESYDDLFPYEIDVKQQYVSSRSCLVLTEEEFNKIKEWLEDDN